MCGIAGFTHSALGVSQGVDEDVIVRMTSALIHRGPDQQGHFAGKGIALGAVRLKVIDLEGGDQPLQDEASQTVIVFNGEIYNFRQLRRQLEACGHRFRSRSDTEVALHAFLEWDTDCFQRFRGMFALAIWSRRERRLVLARDRMGIKPLYIRRTRNDIVFGSELKALFAHPRVTRRLDHAALQDFLSLNYVPSPRTLVEGIAKLPSGHFLDWRNGRETIRRWWKLELAPDPAITEADAVEELDFHLRESVREHLTSDVPLGIWASGGIDSSTLLHYAAEAGARPLKTFSIAFESKSCDERPWFREMARRYGTRHHEFELTRDSDLASAIEDMAGHSDEPGADAGALPVWFLSKLTRQHATVRRLPDLPGRPVGPSVAPDSPPAPKSCAAHCAPRAAGFGREDRP